MVSINSACQIQWIIMDDLCSHCITYIHCWKKKINYNDSKIIVWNDLYQKLVHCMCRNTWNNYIMVFVPGQKDGCLISAVVLAYPLHPITTRSRNKCRNLWLGWCVSSWRPRFGAIFSSCYLSNRKRLFLRIVGVVMPMCWMIWYFYFCPAWFQMYCFDCIVQDSLYHDVDIGRYRVALCIGQLHHITVYRTVFMCTLVLLECHHVCILPILW